MSKILVLGGVGAMASETTRDLVKTSDFEKITIADIDVKEAEEFAATLKDDRVSVTGVDANNVSEVVKLMRGYDVVANGLPRTFGLSCIKAAIEARVDAIDFTSLNPEKLALDSEAKKAGVSYIGGVGGSPGVTNLAAQLGAERLDSVEQIDIDFVVFTPIAFSPGLLQSIFNEFGSGPKLRSSYEDGKLLDNPPFSGAKVVNFLEPIGKQTTYFVPHGETVTLPKNIKGVKRVAVRGCLHPKIMRLMRVINDYGIFTSGPIEFEGKKIVPLDFLVKYLFSVPEGRKCEVVGVAGQIEVTGMLNGKKVMLRFVRRYPPEWSGAECLARLTGGSLSVGAHLLAQGKAKKKGVDGAEAMLPAQEFFDELQKHCGFKLSEEMIEL